MTESTIDGMLERAATLWPQKEALVVDKHRVCYAELLAASRKVASALAALNIKPRDRVGILANDSIEYMSLVFGANLMGAVPVLLNRSWPDEYYPDCFKALGMNALIVSDGMLHDRGMEILQAEKLPLALISLTDIAGGSNGRLPAAARGKADQTAAILFTAGTTGAPKPCCLSHENLTAKIASFVKRVELNEQSRLWIGVPMYQVGFLAPLIAAMNVGATVIMSTITDPESMRMTLIREEVTHAYPIYLHHWLPIIYGPNFKVSDFRSLSHLSLIGPARTLRRIQRALPQCAVQSIYGGPEGGGGYCMPRSDDPMAVRIESCGRPFDGHEVRIVSPDDGRELEPQQIGEIQARGKGIPQPCDFGSRETDFTADGWMRTGDIGMLTEAGNLVYLGRESEMLKIGGEVVPASRLEALFLDHPDIAMAQILPMADEALGEAVWAFIELRPGADLSAGQIIEYYQTRMPETQLPRAITFMEDWPVSASKIQKIVLKDLQKDWRAV
ncbi:Acyl-CoA synthetase (AMP-forming)/AMP-acid ligase II [Sphingobium faniae]|nr:Acyl-CoA synthetase (AMP-forming)/AMP-acid ligase II [Sphingobium faniae]